MPKDIRNTHKYTQNVGNIYFSTWQVKVLKEALTSFSCEYFVKSLIHGQMLVFDKWTLKCLNSVI